MTSADNNNLQFHEHHKSILYSQQKTYQELKVRHFMFSLQILAHFKFDDSNTKLKRNQEEHLQLI